MAMIPDGVLFGLGGLFGLRLVVLLVIVMESRREERGKKQ